MSKRRPRTPSDKIRSDFVDTPERQCHGKVRYHTKKAAKAAIRRVTSRPPGLTEYKCPHCGFHHIGGRLKDDKGRSSDES